MNDSVNDAVYGVHIGTVKSNKLDSEGRIEITLEGINGNAGKYRARVATLMAGPDRGMLFLPEEEDQVLVAFEQGCFFRPVVIGALWNKQDKPPEMPDNQNNDFKLIKTKGGNEIRIIEKGGKERIEISSKGDINIKGKTITLDGDVHITGVSRLDEQLEVGTGPKTIISKNEIKGS